MLSNLEIKGWKPGVPTSKGATAYHNAVIDAPYYVNIVRTVVQIAKRNIKEKDTVVDFGAGTGVSAFYLLQNFDLRFKLWLVDNSAAWLGKAYEIFKNKS